VTVKKKTNLFITEEENSDDETATKELSSWKDDLKKKFEIKKNIPDCFLNSGMKFKF